MTAKKKKRHSTGKVERRSGNAAGKVAGTCPTQCITLTCQLRQEKEHR